MELFRITLAVVFRKHPGSAVSFRGQFKANILRLQRKLAPILEKDHMPSRLALRSSWYGYALWTRLYCSFYLWDVVCACQGERRGRRIDTTNVFYHLLLHILPWRTTKPLQLNNNNWHTKTANIFLSPLMSYFFCVVFVFDFHYVQASTKIPFKILWTKFWYSCCYSTMYQILLIQIAF